MKSTLSADIRLRKILALLSAVFVVVLAVELLWDYRLANDTEPEVAGTDSGSLSMGAEPVPPPELTDYDEIINRPLFSAERRPYEPEQVKAASREPPRQDRQTLDVFSLSGVAIAGDTRLALIRSARDPKLQRLVEGEALNGWRLTEIHADSITFYKDTQTCTLDLMKTANGK